MNVQRRDEEAAHQRKTRGEDAEGRGAALLKLYKLYQQGVALLHFFFFKGFPLQQQNFTQKQTTGSSCADAAGRQEAAGGGGGPGGHYGPGFGNPHPCSGQLSGDDGTLRDAWYL